MGGGTQAISGCRRDPRGLGAQRTGCPEDWVPRTGQELIAEMVTSLCYPLISCRYPTLSFRPRVDVQGIVTGNESWQMQ